MNTRDLTTQIKKKEKETPSVSISITVAFASDQAPTCATSVR